MLSNVDIEYLERLGFDKAKFIRYDRSSFAKIKNHRGFCVFYDTKNSCCLIYRHRPLGCRFYPVIYSEQEGIIVDDLCPKRDTVSKLELKRMGKRLIELLQRIDKEAHVRDQTLRTA